MLKLAVLIFGSLICLVSGFCGTDPTGIKVTKMARTSITVTWDTTNTNCGYTITGYRVYFNTLLGSNPIDKHKDVTGFNTNTAVIFPIASAFTYTIYVNALTANGEMSNPTKITYNHPHTIPAVGPSNMHMTNQRITSLSIAWDELPAFSKNGIIKGYRIFYVGPGLSGTQHAFKMGEYNRTLTVSGLQPNSTYKFVIQAVNDIGYGKHSPTVSFKTLPLAITTTVEKITVFPTTNSSTKPTIAPTSTMHVATTSSYTSATTTLLSEHQSSPPAIMLTISSGFCGTGPTGITVTKKTRNSITVTWDTTNTKCGYTITGYRVYFETLLGRIHIDKHKDVTGSNTNTAVIYPIASAFTYTIYVKALTANGEEPNPTKITYIHPHTLPAVAPSNIHMTNQGITSLSIAWDELPAFSKNGIIKGYRIYYVGPGLTGTQRAIKMGGNNRTLTVSGLQPNSTYKFIIKAVNDIGDGRPSPTVSFTTLPLVITTTIKKTNVSPTTTTPIKPTKTDSPTSTTHKL